MLLPLAIQSTALQQQGQRRRRWRCRRSHRGLPTPSLQPARPPSPHCHRRISPEVRVCPPSPRAAAAAAWPAAAAAAAAWPAAAAAAAALLVPFRIELPIPEALRRAAGVPHVDILGAWNRRCIHLQEAPACCGAQRSLGEGTRKRHVGGHGRHDSMQGQGPLWIAGEGWGSGKGREFENISWR